MKRTNIGSFALALAFVVVAPTYAHHGTAAFNTKTMVTVKANITDFVFTNPHVQVYFEVKNEKGAMEKWQGELTAPNKLIRAGWSKSTLKSGDSVTISGFQVQSGDHTLWIRKLIGPDGIELPLVED